MRKTIFTLCLLFAFWGVKAQSNSLDFDGIDDYVSIPHSPSLSIGAEYSIELWFKAPNMNQFGTLTSKRQPNSPWSRVQLFINDGSDPVFTPSPGKKMTFSFAGPTINRYRVITTTNDIVDGNYHHVAAVINSVTEVLSLYVDGVLQPVNTDNSGAFPYINHSEPFMLGQNNGNAAWYTGTIDEVRIWNIARSAAEIAANMNTEIACNSANLVANWRFNQGAAGGNNVGLSTLDDCTANNNDGTLTDFALNGSSSNWVVGATALPVELTDFKTIAKESRILLKWKTASETNNYGFELQKSHDGRAWQTFGFIEGYGTSHEQHSYSFLDKTPYQGLNYYRLRQIDYDGGGEYSPVRSVDFRKENSSLSIRPNPFSDRLFLESPQDEILESIRIFDLLGQLVFSETHLSQNELNLSGLVAGSYLLEARIGSQLYFQKIIKRD